MVVLVILGVISVGAITAITSQNKVYYSEEDLVNMQMNAKVAMDRIGFLIRMAGTGCIGNFGNKLASGDMATFSKSDDTDPPSYPVYNDGSTNDQLNQMIVIEDDTGINGTDKLTIAGAIRYVGEITAIPSLTQLKLQCNETLKIRGSAPKNLVTISPRDDNRYLPISAIDSVTSKTPTLTLNPGLDNFDKKEMDNLIAKGIELSLFQVNAFTIRVVNNCLRIDDNIDNSGIDLDVSENIQDLQFQYGIDTDTPPNNRINSWVDSPTDISQIRAVKVFILARTGKFDKDYSDRKTYNYAGKSVSFTQDNLNDPNTSRHIHHRLYESTIVMRNMFY